jgi:hypothetical protein
MSFQAYLDTIERKTGKSPSDLRRMAEVKGFTQDGTLAAGVKVTAVTDWLKADFGLDHGHAMAVFALLNGMKKRGGGLGKVPPSH